MIAYALDPNTKIIELTVSGSITATEIKDVSTKLNADTDRLGKVRVLEDIQSLDGISPAALWEDIKRGVPMMGHVSHAAIVADQKWIKVMADIAGVFTSAEIKTFDHAQKGQALAWLKAA